MQDTFLTKTPMYFTIVLVCTFLFTSLVFMYYDFAVEKRQMVILKQAVQSTEVINTLYPAEVRDRLFEDKNNNANSSKDKRQMRTDGEEAPSADSACIADSYEHATGMYNNDTLRALAETNKYHCDFIILTKSIVDFFYCQ
jgi:hypothetical protein